jgi:hypothetical protein
MFLGDSKKKTNPPVFQQHLSGISIKVFKRNTYVPIVNLTNEITLNELINRREILTNHTINIANIVVTQKTKKFLGIKFGKTHSDIKLELVNIKKNEIQHRFFLYDNNAKNKILAHVNRTYSNEPSIVRFFYQTKEYKLYVLDFIEFMKSLLDSGKAHEVNIFQAISESKYCITQKFVRDDTYDNAEDWR